MDPEAFLDLANQVTKLKMFPYFEAAHCAITCLYVREDLAAGAHLFSRKHPLSCWISSMVSIFAGAMLASFLLGEPILAALKNQNSLLMATAVCPTKACIVAAVIFVLDKKTDIISAPHALVYFGIVIFLVYFKLSSMLLGIHDPFLPFENLFCAIFMGGVWDALGRAIAGARGGGGDDNKNGKPEATKKKD